MKFIPYRYLWYCLALITSFAGINTYAANTRTQELSAADRLVVSAYQAFNRKDQAKLTALQKGTQKHVLAPWVAFWRAQLELEQWDIKQITQFMQDWPQMYVSRTLKKQWLALQGETQNWDAFTQGLDNESLSDNEIYCYRLIQLYQTQGRDISQEAALIWEREDSQSKGCHAMAVLLFNHQVWPIAKLWERLRLYFEDRRLSDALELTKGISAVNHRLIAQAYRKPKGVLFQLQPGRDDDLASIALIRFAAKNPEAAAVYFQSNWRTMSQALRGYVWGEIARSAAVEHNQKALLWYERAEGHQLSQRAYEWYIRAALRAGKWDLVSKAYEQMPTDMQSEITWRYWYAQAKKMLGNHELALQLLSSILLDKGVSFYKLLAREELQLPLISTKQAPTVSAELVKPMPQLPEVQRVYKLLELGMRREALSEWADLRDYLSQQQKHALAVATCARQIWDRCINLAESLNSDIYIDLAYPTPFASSVYKGALKSAIEPELIFAVMRQESRFVADIGSSAGAKGLMQIMPATGKVIAKKNHQKYNRNLLLNPTFNISLGAAYLHLLSERFDNSIPLMLSGYNAGPKRPARWRKTANGMGAVYVENIPFNETRLYVKKVLSNLIVYQVLRSKTPQNVSLLSILGEIQPHNSDISDLP